MALLVCTLHAECPAAILNAKRRWCNRCFQVVVVDPRHLSELVGTDPLELVCGPCVTFEERGILRAFEDADLEDMDFIKEFFTDEGEAGA